MTSYQKLKAENAKLKHDIYTLIRKPNTMEGVLTNMQYDIMFSIEDMVWGGSFNTEHKTFDGFLSKIK
jgi:1-aminocyclopropane-1-carboxylate deaminase/D-cysteine desulfhydrase-like pyridoxal-dependent ACC family enzyme